MMFCSLRLYIDKTPDPISTRHILNIFELFASIFGWSYDYILHTLFDPEKDRTLIDKKYMYDFVGKRAFLDTSILPMVTGSNGDLSAPFICATCKEKATQLYSTLRVQIQFPVYAEPFIIGVDYEQNSAKKLTLETYSILIQSLNAMGFCVNNGFFHIYRGKNEAATLDGGQIGSVIGYYGCRNLKKALIHRKKNCLNRLMDIYCANSIRIDLLSKDILEEIVKIVGISNVILDGKVCSFALGNLKKMTSAYRIKYAIMLRKLRGIFIAGEAQ